MYLVTNNKLHLEGNIRWDNKNFSGRSQSIVEHLRRISTFGISGLPGETLLRKI